MKTCSSCKTRYNPKTNYYLKHEDLPRCPRCHFIEAEVIKNDR